jgi:hypothetical protein
LLRVFLAKRYVKPIKKVAEIFRTKNAKMLELTIPDINGLSSEAPKYITPIIVVKQSIEPNRIIKKLGNTSVFKAYMKPSPSPLPFPSQNNLLDTMLKKQIAKFDIFQNQKAKILTQQLTKQQLFKCLG